MRCDCTQIQILWAAHDVLSACEKPILPQMRLWGMFK